MKNLIKSILLVTALAATSLGMSATASAETNRIAVVDVGAVFQQLPQRDEIAQSLQREFRERIERMQEMEQEIGELRERIQRDESIMSEDERNQAMQEFEQRVGQAQQRGEELNEEMRRRQNEERDRLLSQMQTVIAGIAEEEGYDIVLEANSVAFARDSYDISSKIIEEMTND
ncbi:molecular chaperone [Aliidiomarina minuta]|uniref:Molecular chaperone n=1 Tax=Aliidiomarina minuta TaxID=880057 RepID=A0A432W5T1_9GAMM|nr:OmpH family outer membrane protein [Aliidiomarina minuta]RUO25417.1 molecular chaperone [Aliidiomarina minuta]